jgi:predicted nucleic acid-binding protein
MRIALDSNFLLYAAGVNDHKRAEAAQQILDRLSPRETFVPVQVLGEVFRVLTRKAKRKPADVRAIVLDFRDTYPLLETTPRTLLSAMDLSVDHQVNIWDSIIVSCAAEADCRLLLSEDLHDGFTWRGLTVVNPFAEKPHSLLTSALDEANS